MLFDVEALAGGGEKLFDGTGKGVVPAQAGEDVGGVPVRVGCVFGDGSKREQQS